MACSLQEWPQREDFLRSHVELLPIYVADLTVGNDGLWEADSPPETAGASQSTERPPRADTTEP
jgi:hypothetical protein